MGDPVKTEEEKGLYFLSENTPHCSMYWSVRSSFCRFQPAGLVERIQAIAQNVSNMANRVEQILQNSIVQGRGTSATHLCAIIRLTSMYTTQP